MNKDLRDRLFKFEALPSAGLWDKIAQSLDDDTEYSLAERMLHYEAPPPSNSWENIVELMDRDTQKVVPFNRNFSYLKYAGVAGALITCVVISFLYVSNKQDGHQLSTVNEKGSLLQSPPPNNRSDKINSDYDSEAANGDETANVILSSHARQGYAIRLHPLPSRKTSSIKNKLSAKLPPKKPLVSSEHLERYIVFSRASGEAIRLSKKLFGLFACSERDINCEENIKSVQQKMASASMMASTDFTGMLEALQTMNKEHNN